MVSHRHSSLNLASFAPATMPATTSEAMIADDPECGAGWQRRIGSQSLTRPLAHVVGSDRWMVEVVGVDCPVVCRGQAHAIDVRANF